MDKHIADDVNYAAKFKQMDKEAIATFGTALLVTIVFWLAIALTHDIQANLLFMPLWFVLSCIGGYLFSIVVVLVLVKKIMRNLELKVSSVKDLNEPTTTHCSTLSPSSSQISSNFSCQKHKD